MVKSKVKIRPLTVKCRPGTVVYVVTRKQTIKRIPTGCNVSSDEWNEETSAPASVNRDRQTPAGQSAIRKPHTKIGHTGNPSFDVTPKCGCPDKNSFFNFMDILIEHLRQSNRLGTAKNYQATLGSFKRFRNNKDISMEAIDSFIMEDYQAYLKSAGITLNSISFYMRILHAAYNRAVEQNLTEDRKPFRKVFTGVEKTRKRAISINDIRRIKKLELPLGSDLELARDLFLFFSSAGECPSSMPHF